MEVICCDIKIVDMEIGSGRCGPDAAIRGDKFIVSNVHIVIVDEIVITTIGLVHREADARGAAIGCGNVELIVGDIHTINCDRPCLINHRLDDDGAQKWRAVRVGCQTANL